MASPGSIPQIPIEKFLGYDPWAFPRLINPRRDFALMVFGWCIYDAMECMETLFYARAKWKSSFFQALAWGVLLQTWASTMQMVFNGCPLNVISDLFAGQTEFFWATFWAVCVTLARWAYMYATLNLIMTTLPRNRLVTIIVYVVTPMAVFGSLGYLIAYSILYQRQYDQYTFYMATQDAYAVLGRTPTTVSPVVPVADGFLGLETATMLIFVLVTKLPFLSETYSKFNGSYMEATKIMASNERMRQIFFSSMWSIVEAGITASYGNNDITIAMKMYVLLLQMNTLSLLAYGKSASAAKTTGSAITSRAVGPESKI